MEIQTVNNKSEGIQKAKQLLYEKVTPKTVLFISGGTSPKLFYEILAQEKRLSPGAVGMVDERYGKPFHDNSNEKMIRETGLLNYFEEKEIPWYPMLQAGLPRDATAKAYDEKLRELFVKYPDRVAIVSIGADGHTAGLPAQMSNVKYQIWNDKFVSEYENEKYGLRVTMTFRALEQIDWFLLWVFGDEKREALRKMFEKGNEEEIPARFYLRREIEDRVVLITDQTI